MARVWQPAHVRPGSDDTRLLGIAVSRVLVDGKQMGLDAPSLFKGRHAREPEWRWTGGDAWIATQGACVLAFEVALTGSYWRDEECSDVRAA